MIRRLICYFRGHRWCVIPGFTILAWRRCGDFNYRPKPDDLVE